MPKIEDLELTGRSGKMYRFGVYGARTNFKNLGGVYAITRRTVNVNGSDHAPIYVGETDNLRKCFQNHYRQVLFDENAANAVCVHLDSSGQSRFAKETDLRNGYDWVCNQE